MLHPRTATMSVAALSALALVGAGSAVVAQDESPAAQDAAAQDDAAAMSQAHPLHIHSGTCDQLGDVVFPLGEISSDLMVHGEAAGDDMVGSVTEQDVALNVTLVAATIDDLTAEDHAINIHRSAEAMGEYIACGDIGGTRIDGDTLLIRLSPLNDSGYVGFGLLQQGDDGNTTVYSMLTQMGAMAGAPMEEPLPEQSPAGDESMTEDGEGTDAALEDVTDTTGDVVEDATEQSDDATGESGDTTDDSADATETSEPDVTVEVTVEGDQAVDVDVEEGAEESPAA